MKNIDFTEIQENIDIEMAKSKNLIKDDDYTNYGKIYFKYRNGLEYLLKKITPIEQYDKKIKNSDLGFLEVLEEEKDFYQYLSTLKYFYLRNNLYIERLENDYIKKINEIDITKEQDINELLQIVMKTYKEIIIEYPEVSTDTIISFGFDDINLMPYNGSVIIGFRYDEYRNEETLGDNWENNYKKQVEMLEKMLPMLEEGFANILKNNVKIIQYNEFSINEKVKI